MRETTRTIAWNWPGSGEELVRAQREIVPQLYTRFESVLSKEDYAAASAESLAEFRAHETAGETRFEVQVHLVTAVR